VEIFAKLTHVERNALRAIAAGQGGAVGIAQLVRLKALDLIHQDGLAWHSPARVGKSRIFVSAVGY
jgi:hypothetical protein